jgi:hypothetical protein
VQLTCTILTFALCADPRVAGAVAFGGLTVPIVWTHVEKRSCMDVGSLPGQEGAGFLRFETAWASQQNKADAAGYSGRLVFRIDNARIEMGAFSWNHMSRADGDALHRMYVAALWHELGHLRTAQASVDAANNEPAFSAATPAAYTDLARAHGDAAVARITADQEDYDQRAEHGIRQDTLPPPLAGADTIVYCPSGRGRSG